MKKASGIDAERIYAAKHERFIKIAEKRMNAVIDSIEKLGNCSSKVSYEYTDAEVEQIISEVERQVDLLKKRFSGQKAFSLSEHTSGKL